VFDDTRDERYPEDFIESYVFDENDSASQNQVDSESVPLSVVVSNTQLYTGKVQLCSSLQH